MEELEAISELLNKTKSDCDIFICRKCGRIDFRDTLDILGSKYGCCADCGSERHYEIDLRDLIEQAKRIKDLEAKLKEFGEHKSNCAYAQGLRGQSIEKCDCGFERAVKG